jgi:predicted lipoprotein with Yx(FWY)xxD motif
MNRNTGIIIGAVVLLISGGIYASLNSANPVVTEDTTENGAMMQKDTAKDGDAMMQKKVTEEGAVMQKVTVTDGAMMKKDDNVIAVSEKIGLGKFLVSPTGMTLYSFTKDETGKSNCYNECATNWPPLKVSAASGLKFGVTGEFGKTTRTDGIEQITYNGKPLYFWKNDKAPGDTTGQGVNNVWFVAMP